MLFFYFVGLCGDLRILFQRVYVAGEADLPLADDGQAEPSVSEAAPEQQEAFPLDDAAGEMQVDAEVAEVAEAHVELVIEDQVLQVSPNERLEKGASSMLLQLHMCLLIFCLSTKHNVCISLIWWAVDARGKPSKFANFVESLNLPALCLRVVESMNLWIFIEFILAGRAESELLLLS